MKNIILKIVIKLLRYFIILTVITILFIGYILYYYFYNSKYLVILQNGGETRPGGGFFGSILILNFKGFKLNIKIKDAYLYQILARKKNIYIKTPSYLRNFLLTDKLYFLNTNIYGISEIDGKNIKYIYEKITGEKINGVIFINSIGLEKINKSLRNKIWEWQFLNTLSYNIKLKSEFDTRKKAYIKNISKYIKNNIPNLLSSIMFNLNYLIDRNYIQMYSTKGKNLLKKIGLLKEYKQNYLYTLEFYLSFNKKCRFFKKIIYINNKYYKNKSDIKLNQNFKGEIKIKYLRDHKLYEEYKQYILFLEKKYKKYLSSEQLSILGISQELKTDHILTIFYLPTDNFSYPKYCEKIGKVLTCFRESYNGKLSNEIKLYLR